MVRVESLLIKSYRFFAGEKKFHFIALSSRTINLVVVVEKLHALIYN